jgi:Ca2+-binding RTX toxin-like protein
LFNAAAGGYSTDMSKNPAAYAAAVGAVLEKDLSSDAAFVAHLLSNFGVSTTDAVYVDAQAALTGMVAGLGRANATVGAIDFLAAQTSTSAYSAIATAFQAKVAAAAAFSTANASELDVSKLIGAVTGVDTDVVAAAASFAAGAASRDAEVADLEVQVSGLEAELAAAQAAAAAAATAAAAELAAANTAAAEAATAAAAALAAANATITLINDTDYASEQAAFDAAEAAGAAALAAAATAAAAELAAANTAAAEAAETAAAEAAALQAEIDALENPAGGNFVLTTSTETVFGVADGDDTITATNLTYLADDVVVDGSSDDTDTLTITTTADMTAAPLVIGIENVDVDINTLLSSGDTTFAFDAGDIRDSTVSFDVTFTDSLVSDLDLNSARTNTYVISDDFATANVGTTADADVVLEFNSEMTLVVSTDDGAADDLTIDAGGFDFVLTSSTSTEDLVITNAVGLTATADSVLGNVTVTTTGDTVVTTSAALGDVTVTAGGTLTVTAAAAEGDVVVTADDDTTVTTTAAEGSVTVTAAGILSVDASAAAGSVVVSNSGGTAGDAVTVDAAATDSLTVTSVGAITFGAAAAAVETMILTAAEATTINSTGASDTAVTLNAVASDDQTSVTFTASAAQIGLASLAFGGDIAVILATDLNELDGITVTNTNTDSATLSFTSDAGNADLSDVASTVDLDLATDATTRTITLADTGEVLGISEDQSGVLTLEAATTTNTTNSLSIAATDDIDLAQLIVTDYATLTLDSSDGTISWDTAATSNTISGDQLATLILVGDNAIDLNTNGPVAILNTATSPSAVTVNASAMTAAVTLTMAGAEGEAEIYVGGSDVDTIVISADSDTGDAYSVTTNSGADVVTVTLTSGEATISTGAGADTITISGGTVTIDAGAGADVLDIDGATDFTFAGGTGVDTILVNTTVDLTSSTFSWSSVEQLDIGNSATLTINASDISGVSFVLTETTAGTSVLDVEVDQVVVDLSGVAVATSWDDGVDTVVVDASGMGLAMTITGSASSNIITGSSRADTIVGGADADTITGGVGADILSGGSGADTFVVATASASNTSDGIDIISDFTGGTDILALAVAASGTINTGSAGADLSIDSADVVSTGTTVTTLLANLSTAAGLLAADEFDDAGDTFVVQITGASYAGTDVYYVVQNTAADTTVTAADTIIALTGTSTIALTVATVVEA